MIYLLKKQKQLTATVSVDICIIFLSKKYVLYKLSEASGADIKNKRIKKSPLSRREYINRQIVEINVYLFARSF